MSELSVVIPVRDGERYLGEALESVLAQSLRPTEVVVVDDGSTDRSAAVAAAFGPPVRVVGQEGAGIAAAINRGIAEARSPLVAFLDADDLWEPGKLELQAGVLAAEPALDAVFGYVVQFISPELSDAEAARMRFRKGSYPFRAKATMLIRREALEAAGPFDEAITVGDFVDWYTRAEDAGLSSRMLDEIVLRRRLHPENHGRTGAADKVDYARVARAALQRRRERGVAQP